MLCSKIIYAFVWQPNTLTQNTYIKNTLIKKKMLNFFESETNKQPQLKWSSHFFQENIRDQW